MITQFETVSKNADIFRNLSALTIAGTEDLIKRQLETTEALVNRGSQQMKEAYEKAGSAQTPLEWSQAMQKNVNIAIETARDCMLATSKLQAENLRLIQEQTTEMQKLIANAWNSTSGSAGTSAPKRTQK